MKRTVWTWQLMGFAVTSLAGTLLHFLYEWLSEAAWIAPFSGVNESTWEHMKLLYFPLLIFALIQSRFFKERKGFWCIKLIGTVIGLAFIPMLFYTYNGAIGKSPDWVNITIFFISAAIAFLAEAHLLRNSFTCKAPRIALVLILVIGVLFVVFTFKTPQLPIFKDPITGTYGI